MGKKPVARNTKPKRAKTEAQEIEELELRLTELDTAAALADDLKAQDGRRE
jgi:hypothetical protein